MKGKKTTKKDPTRTRAKDRAVIRSFYLTEELIAEIERRAEAEERSSSTIVRRALEAHFAANQQR